MTRRELIAKQKVWVSKDSKNLTDVLTVHRLTNRRVNGFMHRPLLDYYGKKMLRSL